MDDTTQEIWTEDLINLENQVKEYKKTLEEVYRHLDNLKYECSTREYTLDEDEISWIFYCRDTIWLTLKKFGKENG